MFDPNSPPFNLPVSWEMAFCDIYPSTQRIVKGFLMKGEGIRTASPALLFAA
jgi:hypothetical protein